MPTAVSYHQERLWFIDRFERGNLYESSPVYHNIPFILEIRGPLDPGLLERSIAGVIDRHEALRTRIITVDHGPVPQVGGSGAFKLEFLDLSGNGLEGLREDKDVLNLVLEEVRRPFLMEKDLLIRGKLFKNKDREFVLVLVLHHIIADYYSLHLLVNEMLWFYREWGNRREPHLPDLNLQYADFARWQRDFSPRALKPLQFYWKRKLCGKLQPLELPTDRPRALIHIFKEGRKPFSLDKTLTAGTRTLAVQLGGSPAVVLLGAFKVLLHRYSGLGEIIVGTGLENRDQPGTEGIIGPLANLVVLRSELSGEFTFTRFVAQLRETMAEAIRYGAMPFDRLVTELDPHKDMSRTALFDVLFQYREHFPAWTDAGELTVDIIETNLGWGKYDWNVLVEDKGETFNGVAVFNAEYYDEWRISRMIAHFTHLIEQVTANPDRPLKYLDILTPPEKKQLLEEWSGIARETHFPFDLTLHDLFENQRRQIPDHTAVIGGTRKSGRGFHPFRKHLQLTYRELDEKSRQVAHLLKEKGVVPDTLVGITADRSPGMVAGMLGILKAGGAYLPIDPDYPAERIDYMLKDSGVQWLVTDGNIESIINRTDMTYRSYRISATGHRPPATAVSPSTLTSTSACQVGPANLAYIIYTSGSTGRPKGVLVTHRDVVRLFINEEFQFDFGPRDVWTMFHSPCFDFSVWEMYGALLFGGKLLVIPREVARDTRHYLEVLKRHRVTVLNQTPSAFYALMNEESPAMVKELNLGYVIFGGEALAPGKLKGWRVRYPHTRLINMYGITETTVHVTFKEITPKEMQENLCNIGKPIPTLFVYVLDDRMEPAAVGAPGELYVGGAGLARGYLNQSLLTAEKFVENPHKRGTRLYRSGDLVRFLSDGEMEYLGRIDAQVQLRGFRVEPGEIENRLMGFPGVKGAVVHVWEDAAGDKYLCAYVAAECPDRGRGPGWEELREYLAQTLPDYMIPAYFIPLEKIPLTANGKVDRKALPAPRIEKKEDHLAPRDDIEKKLVDIWSGILGVEKEKIGIDANFFHMGGHSLKATVLVSRVHKELDVNLPLAEVFKAPQVQGLAAYIRKAVGSKHIPVEPVEGREYYPLSSAQRRLYILQGMDNREGTGYNMPSFWQLEGEIDGGKIEGVFRELVRRHESLRTSFHLVNGEPVQVIHDEVEFNLTTEGTGGQSKVFGGVQGNLFSKRFPWPPEAVKCQGRGEVSSPFIDSFIRPFDLSRAPLLRVGLIAFPHTPSALRVHPSQEGKSDRYLLMVDMHHIVSDGVSVGIFIKEFTELYAGKGLPRLRLQYKDYSLWHVKSVGRACIKGQEIYWLKQFEGEIPVLEIPTDYPRPVVQGFAGRGLRFEISREETAALKSLARRQDVTLFMLLFSFYVLFLSKISQQEDIVVGTPVAGRGHTDIEGIIGMFVNTLALRSFPGGGKTFGQFLGEIKENTIRAFENRDYLYEDLVEQVKVERDTGRNPLFDIMFVLQNMDIPAVRIPGLTVTPYDYEHRTAKFDLLLTAVERGAELVFTLEYSTHLFKEETIRRYIGFFRRLLAGIPAGDETRIWELEIISEEEKSRVLEEFNDTAADYPKYRTIHSLFEEQVEQRPHQVALVGSIPGDGAARSVQPVQLTYRELNERSGGLAGWLIERGVRPDVIVGIMVERSVEMVVGIFGILKAGGAYMPIDPGYPRERIDFMMKDSGAQLLVTHDDIESIINRTYRSYMSYKSYMSYEVGTTLSTHRTHLTHRTRQSLAYVIYTSGTTGRPKGVLVEHASAVNLLYAMQQYYPFGETDVYLLKTSYIFDVSVAELFGWYMGGGRIILLEMNGHKDPRVILESIERHGVTHIDFVPSMFNAFVETLAEKDKGRLPGLKYIFLAGEVLPPGLVEKFRALNTAITLENIYGPTESTVYASKYSLGDWKGSGSIPIGRPLPNIRLYILSKNDGVQPIGIVGELCIGGRGLARGYLNRPGLTAEKFIMPSATRNPFINGLKKLAKKTIFSSVPGELRESSAHKSVRRKMARSAFLGWGRRPPFEKGFLDLPKLLINHHLPFTTHHSPIYRTGDPAARGAYKSNILYKTGDLARWQTNGEIEFLGRMDHQVKIRGFRIELGEIENQLVKHEKIKEAVVTAADSETNEKYLCAYLVAHGDPREIPVSALREYLLKTLPGYMVPAYFVLLERIPLTATGKLNRKALPGPEILAGSRYVAPRDNVEARLVDIWAGELGIEKEKIGIDANFFEWGGHSLRATRIIARIHKELGVNITMAEMFGTPYVRALAERIKGRAVQKYSAVEPVEKKEYYTLSPGQKRLYILQQMDEQGVAYNIPFYSVLAGEPRQEMLENAFKRLIKRHESLRTSFRMVKDDPVQRIHEENYKLQFTNYKQIPNYNDQNYKQKGSPSGILFTPSAKKVETQDIASLTPNTNTNTNTDTNTNTIIKNFIQPFDLSRAPLFRVGLIEIDKQKKILMVDMHHIVSDGVSGQILLRDFSALYTGAGLAGIRLQYKDYAEWQNRREREKNLLEQKMYWENEFKGEIPVLNLPADYPRPAVQSYEGRTSMFEINRETTAGLETLALDTGTTLYMVLLSLYTLLLSKLSNQEDVVVGTPAAGRHHADLEGIIGMFVNTLVLRSNPTGEKKFSQYLQEVKEKALKAFENQAYQYEDLVELVAVRRDTGRNPLFDTMFILQNMEIQPIEVPGLAISPYEYRNQTSKFDWTLTAMGAGDKLLFTLEYCTKIFAPGSIERYTGYFKKIISEVLAQWKENPRLSEIEMIPWEEKQRILREFNATGVEYPGDKTIHRLYEEQVEKTPDHVALIGRGALRADISAIGVLTALDEGPIRPVRLVRPVRPVQLTYNELNERSEAMANYLREKGVEVETITGIMVERTLEMITGILAILKAGGAYLPIDPDYPEGRIDYMLKDSGAQLLVTTNNKEGEKVRRWEGEKIFLSEILEFLKSNALMHSCNHAAMQPCNLTQPTHPFNQATIPSCNHATKHPCNTPHPTHHIHHTHLTQPTRQNLAYVIYTSGTTGKPKGVMIPHRNVVNFIRGMSGGIPFLPGKTILNVTTISFDIFVLETLLPLARGMEIVLSTEREQIDPDALAEIMLKNCVRMAQFTPSRLKMVLSHREGFEGLRYVSELLVGGEAFPIDLYTEVKALCPGRIFNMYGPTETTIWSAYKELTAAENITIGGPVANTQVYILDAAAAVQPVGVVGELYIGGDGVARGYLNKPELTAEKFIMSDRSDRSDKSDKSDRLYKTGDLACWRSDGNIEFLGRSDHQVKIRGFRIELGEIENQLLKCRGIEAAAVIDRDREGKKHLCAYFVSKQKPGISELKSILVKALPDYMIPSYFIQVEKIPLMLSGKIDRKALESYGMEMKVREEYTAPRDKIEQQIAQLWKDVLSLERVGINENFFDLGGTSLDILRLGMKMKDVFNEKESVVQLFRYPTIISFAEYLGRKRTGKESENDIQRTVSVDSIKKSRQSQKNKRMRGELSR